MSWKLGKYKLYLYPEFSDELERYEKDFNQLNERLNTVIASYKPSELYYQIRLKLQNLKANLDKSKLMHDLKEYKLQSDFEARILGKTIDNPSNYHQILGEKLVHWKEAIVSQIEINFRQKTDLQMKEFNDQITLNIKQS